MTDLLTRGQLDLLAQTLGVTAADLGTLDRFDADEIRALRERISDLLFDAHAETFARVSRLAPIIPNALAANVALRAVPAEAAGRAGGAIGMDHPDRAAGLLAALTPAYMADAAPFLDPRAIAVLAPRIPAEVLVPAAEELLRRREYGTAASFLDYATDDLVRGFERGITDDAGLLRTAALSPSSERLDRVVRLLPMARRVRIARVAATGDDALVLAALSVLSRLDSDLANQLGEELFGQSDAVTGSIIAIAHRAGAHRELLTCLAALSDSTLSGLARHPALRDLETIEALSRATGDDRARMTVNIIAVHRDEPRTD